MQQIFVFSGTGNTLYAARRAGEGEATEIVPMARHRHDGTVLARGDVVGIAAPVYAAGLPALVKSFLAKLVLRPRTWTYLLLTSGGWPFGAGALGRRILERQGIGVDAIFHVPMPDNYPSRLIQPGEGKRRELLLRAEDATAAVARAVAERRREFFPGFFPGATALGHERLLAWFRARERRFAVTDRCTGCGLCRTLCPVENVVLDGLQRPQWLHRCEGCMACFHWCPSQAIQIGRFSRGLRRFHHPAVTPEELVRGIPLPEARGGEETVAPEDRGR